MSKVRLWQRMDAGLKERLGAAHRLIAADPDIDRLLLLSYVVWPTAKLLPVRLASSRDGS